MDSSHALQVCRSTSFQATATTGTSALWMTRATPGTGPASASRSHARAARVAAPRQGCVRTAALLRRHAPVACALVAARRPPARRPRPPAAAHAFASTAYATNTPAAPRARSVRTIHAWQRPARRVLCAPVACARRHVRPGRPASMVPAPARLRRVSRAPAAAAPASASTACAQVGMRHVGHVRNARTARVWLRCARRARRAQAAPAWLTVLRAKSAAEAAVLPRRRQLSWPRRRGLLAAAP